MEKLLTKLEAAKVLQVSDRTIHTLIKNGELRSVKVGMRGVRIAPDALEEYLHPEDRKPNLNSCIILGNYEWDEKTNRDLN